MDRVLKWLTLLCRSDEMSLWLMDAVLSGLLWPDPGLITTSFVGLEEGLLIGLSGRGEISEKDCRSSGGVGWLRSGSIASFAAWWVWRGTGSGRPGLFLPSVQLNRELFEDVDVTVVDRESGKFEEYWEASDETTEVLEGCLRWEGYSGDDDMVCLRWLAGVARLGKRQWPRAT